MRHARPFALLLALALASAAPVPVEAGPPAPRLKAGCYRAVVRQRATANATGETVTDELKLEIMVTGLDGKGGVEAEVTLGLGEGKPYREKGAATGRVDGKGVLYLSGTLRHSALPGDRAFSLTAKARGDALVDGSYVKKSASMTSKGSFKKAVYTIK